MADDPPEPAGPTEPAAPGTAPGPDDDWLLGQCGHLLRRVQQVHTSLWTEEVGERLTSPQYAVLDAVRAIPGSDQRRVSALASLDRSSTTEVVGRLEQRGLLVRGPDPRDSRRDDLRATPAADALLTAVAPGVARVQERLMAPLPPSERTAALESLRLVAAAPDAPGVPALTLPGHLVRRAQQRHTVLLAEAFGREVTGPQLAVLHVVDRAPGISQRAVGDRAGLDRSTTADLARRLVSRGLLERERDPTDSRRWRLGLTDQGRRLLARYAARVDGVQEKLLAPLPPDRRPALRHALAALAGPTG